MSQASASRVTEDAAGDVLRHLEEQPCGLFDRSLDCVYFLDFQGRFLDANPAALSLVGYTREEMQRLEAASLLEPEQLPLLMRRIEELRTSGQNHDLAEFRVRCKDGRHVVVESKASVIRIGGKPAAILGIARDITERKRIEAELRQSEEKFRTLVENMAAAVGIVQGTRFVYANRYMGEMLGYTVEQILSMDFPELVHPDYRERMIELARRRHMGEAVPGNYEFIAMTSAGEPRWIDFSVGRMIYQGRPAIIGTGFDITQRKRLEETRCRSEERLRLLADTANRLLMADRPHDMLRGIFEAVAAHIGADIYLNYLVTPDGARLRLHAWRGLDEPTFSKLEFVEFGQPFCGIAARERRRLILDHVQACRDCDTAMLRAMGVTAYACYPLVDGGVLGAISFCARDRDQFGDDELDLMRAVASQVSMALHQQRLTDELQQRAAALDEANRAKDHFLAVLSHELRTPLTAVLPALGALAKLIPAESQEYLEMAQRNVELEARIIDDLLDVTRIARGKIELDRKPVRLCEIVGRAAEVCKADIEARGLHFQTQFEKDRCTVNGDAARLLQVFWNLIKNAVKFTPHGGWVAIRCRRREGTAVVQVSDNGEGIEPEAIGRIFNAFEQAECSTARQFGGLGLGLAISKALVEMHGGAIRAESAGRAKGATFTVELPLASGGAAECGCGERKTAPPPQSASGAAPAPLRILLVEDHGDTARILSQLLRADGHEVRHAGDVAAALELAGAEHFDLLLSDLGLPDGNGHDLMRALRERGKAIPGIALSGYGMSADVQHSREAGFAEHVTKPVNFDVLTAAVQRVAGRGAGV